MKRTFTDVKAELAGLGVTLTSRRGYRLTYSHNGEIGGSLTHSLTAAFDLGRLMSDRKKTSDEILSQPLSESVKAEIARVYHGKLNLGIGLPRVSDVAMAVASGKAPQLGALASRIIDSDRLSSKVASALSNLRRSDRKTIRFEGKTIAGIRYRRGDGGEADTVYIGHDTATGRIMWEDGVGLCVVREPRDGENEWTAGAEFRQLESDYAASNLMLSEAWQFAGSALSKAASAGRIRALAEEGFRLLDAKRIELSQTADDAYLLANLADSATPIMSDGDKAGFVSPTPPAREAKAAAR